MPSSRVVYLKLDLHTFTVMWSLENSPRSLLVGIYLSSIRSVSSKKIKTIKIMIFYLNSVNSCRKKKTKSMYSLGRQINLNKVHIYTVDGIFITKWIISILYLVVNLENLHGILGQINVEKN